MIRIHAFLTFRITLVSSLSLAYDQSWLCSQQSCCHMLCGTEGRHVFLFSPQTFTQERGDPSRVFLLLLENRLAGQGRAGQGNVLAMCFYFTLHRCLNPNPNPNHLSLSVSKELRRWENMSVSRFNLCYCSIVDIYLPLSGVQTSP